MVLKNSTATKLSPKCDRCWNIAIYPRGLSSSALDLMFKVEKEISPRTETGAVGRQKNSLFWLIPFSNLGLKGSSCPFCWLNSYNTNLFRGTSLRKQNVLLNCLLPPILNPTQHVIPLSRMLAKKKMYRLPPLLLHECHYIRALYKWPTRFSKSLHAVRLWQRF